MLRVTRRTPGQLNVIADECYHCVVGDAAISWTIIIQDVTQANQALLHVSLSGK